jgi:hypothetical protein
LSEICWRADLALYEAIYHAILEACEERRGQAVACEEQMGRFFFYTAPWSAFHSAAVRQGRPNLLSRSISTSVPFPYARKSTAVLSISFSDRPGRRLAALSSYITKEAGDQN